MRETGPAHKVYAHDQLGREAQQASAPYINAARVVLGQLKNDMKLGGLDTGKKVVQLPDGTLIVAESRYGQDKFSITVPPVPAPQQPPEEHPIPEVPLPEYVPEKPPLEFEATIAAACGQTYPVDTQAQAVVWSTLTSPPLTICQDIASTSDAYAISDNGAVVVGDYVPLTGGSTRAFRWARGTGPVDLPTPTTSPATARCTNNDGTWTGGYCDGGHGQQPCVWNFNGGVELIDALFGVTTCISPSGEYAAGIEFVAPSGTGTWVARRVNGAWQKKQVPNSGAASRIDRFQGSDTGPRAEHYEPVNVDDLGRATLQDDHRTGAYVSQGQRYWPFHESGLPDWPPGSGTPMEAGVEYIVGPNAWYQVDAPNGGSFHQYDYATGTLTRLAYGTSSGVADDVRVAVGTDQYGERGVWSIQTEQGHHLLGPIDPATGEPQHLGDTYTTEYIFHNYIGDPVTRAWWWSQRRGQVILEPDNAAATDISEDGVVIVGYRFEGGLANSVPVFWARGRGRAVDMQYIGNGARVRSVARPQTPKFSI